jgi:DnaJ-domain-containing protein 1
MADVVVGAFKIRDGPGRAGSAKIVMTNIIEEIFYLVTGLIILFLIAKGSRQRKRREEEAKAQEQRRRDNENARVRERERQANEARKKAEENRRLEEERAQKERRQRQGTRSNKQAPDPYEVLQVTRGASRQEIKAAYLSMIKRYHPDRVSHLGKEVQDIAEKKAKEINEAYDTLMSSL